MDAIALFQKLRDELPQLEYGGKTWFVVEGDLRLDKAGLLEWCEMKLGARPRPPADGDRLIAETTAEGKIVRWRAGYVIRWCVLWDTFEEPVQAEQVAKNFRLAVAGWEAACGVRFEEQTVPPDTGQTPREHCDFGIGYRRLDHNLIALAFFPNDPPDTHDVFVDPKYFRAEEFGLDPVGILRHELGHVLGFRHEFLDATVDEALRAQIEEDTSFTPLTPPDSKSCMHYPISGFGDPSFAITELDEQGAQKVYGLPRWKCEEYPGGKVEPRERSGALAGPGGPAVYPVWYGTNRELDEHGSPTSARDDELHYGKCLVEIPRTHRFGEIGTSWYRRWMRLEFASDFLRLAEVQPMDEGAFFDGMAQQAAGADLLVYLHGYNVTFEEAAIRAAQIGFDLKVQTTAFFSWPSRGTLLGYSADEASIEASRPQLEAFLTGLVARSGAQRVHVLAHSMGNRALLSVFDALTHVGSTLKFGHVLLAAPDVDSGLFRQLAAAYAKLSSGTTLYVSPRDRAVGLSRFLHDAPRVGFTPPVTVLENIHTVEVTGFDLLDLGHAYFASAAAVLHDMFEVLAHGSPPDERLRLRRVDAGDGPYWVVEA